MPNKTNAQSSREKRQRYKEQGRCTNCGKPAKANRSCCVRCLEVSAASARRWNRRLKEKCYAAYGGFVCTCCGETCEAFLSIDHVNNDGAEDRRRRGLVDKDSHKNGKGGSSFYKQLEREGYPSGYQVLCMNCQWGKRRFGTCPHKLRSHDASLGILDPSLPLGVVRPTMRFGVGEAPVAHQK